MLVVRNQESLHFITCTIVNWISLFVRKDYCDIVIDSLDYANKNKGLRIYAWCLMMNHLHLIVRSETGNLSGIVRDFKTYTNKAIIERIKNGKESRKAWLLDHFREFGQTTGRANYYKVWFDGFYPVELADNQMIDVRLNYIHDNPVKAGFVIREEEYPYSSAIDYCGGKGLLDVELIR